MSVRIRGLCFLGYALVFFQRKRPDQSSGRDLINKVIRFSANTSLGCDRLCFLFRLSRRDHNLE